MTKDEFLELMKFPRQWDEWGMFPDELVEIQLSGYESGHENASEHDRNGAFHWWLRRDPTVEQLIKLLKLTHLDPDQLMAEDVRSYIRKASNYNHEVEAIENAT
jgi:hypothetical protein